MRGWEGLGVAANISFKLQHFLGGIGRDWCGNERLGEGGGDFIFKQGGELVDVGGFKLHSNC